MQPNNVNQGILSILVPAFNEERTIARVLRGVLALGPVVREIIVVDDGSLDATGEIAQRMAKEEPRVRYFRQPKNAGKTAAIRRAIREVTGEIVIVQDADLEYDPAEIPEVISPILAGHADVVFGSRFLVRRAARVLYYYHFLANKLLTTISNLLTNRNMSDVETGYKAFRAGVIRPLQLSSSGFGMEIEITSMICRTRARTYEVPISYYGRTYDEGKKIGMIDALMAVWYLFYYNLVHPLTPSGRRYVRQANAFLAESPEIGGCDFSVSEEKLEKLKPDPTASADKSSWERESVISGRPR